MQIAALFAANLQGRTQLKTLTGETPDISKYLDFGFYDRVWFKENSGLGKTKLAIFLGVSHQVGSLMSYWVLPASGIPASRTMVQRVTNIESQTEQCKKRLSIYDKKIAEIFNEMYIDADYLQDNNDMPAVKIQEELADDDRVFYEEFTRVITNADIPEADDTFDPESFDDNHFNMELDL